MSANKPQKALLLLLVTLLLFAAMLWSWNTIAELFGAPEAEVRHLVAAAILVAAARWIVKPGFIRERLNGQRHEH